MMDLYSLLGGILLPELLIFFWLHLLEHVQSLADKLLLNDLEELMLLKSFSGYIKGEVIRVHHTMDETQVVWHHVLQENIFTVAL